MVALASTSRFDWREVLSFVAAVMLFAAFRLVGDAIVERPGVHVPGFDLRGWYVSPYEVLWPVVPLLVALAVGRPMDPPLRRTFTRAALVVFCVAAGFTSLILLVSGILWYGYLKHNAH